MNDLTIVTNVEDEKWDKFVLLHPHGNIFQSRYMYEVYRKTKNYHPTKLFAVNTATGDLCGILSSVIVNEVGGLLGSISAHSILQGGPLVSQGLEKQVVPLLIAEYDRLCRRKALYSEIRNLNETEGTLDGLSSYKFEGHLNYLINLNQTEDELWHQIHQSRRKNIKRASKENVVVEEMQDDSLVPIFYQILEETYREAKIPLADKTLFDLAFKVLVPNNILKVFLAKHGDKYIGARAVLLYKNVVYDWYAGAYKESLDFHPNDYLVWHILTFGMNHGYQVFDFGGAGKPEVEYGPREFKRRFGGQVVNYGRYKNVYQPIKSKIAATGFEVYRRLFLYEHLYSHAGIKNNKRRHLT